MKLFFTLLLLLCTHYVVAAPAKILIIPFENATSDNKNDSLKTGIPEILTVCFSNNPDQITILDRVSLDANINEQSLSWEKFVADKSMQSIGQITGANFILRGSMVVQDNKLHVQALLFDVASTELRHSVSGAINLNDVVDSICNHIANPLSTVLTKNSKQASKLIIEEFPEKQQLLIDGLNHYYNGEYAQSFAPFLKLVKNYPNDATVHFWLAQSFYQAGLDDFATIQFQDFVTRFQESSRVLKVKAQLSDLVEKKSNKGAHNEKK